MYFVYILECQDKTLYIGITTDLARRVDEHNGVLSGGAKYTRARRPVKIVYVEEFTNRSDAQQREYALKKLSRTEKLQLIFTHPYENETPSICS